MINTNVPFSQMAFRETRVEVNGFAFSTPAYGAHASSAVTEEAAFLNFIDADLGADNRHALPLSASSIERALALVEGVDVSDEETLPGDITI